MLRYKEHHLLNRQLINEHIEEIFLETGAPPTVRCLRDSIGSGSFSTLSQAIKSWKISRGIKKEDARVQMSEASSGEMAQAVWKAVQPILEARLFDQQRKFDEEKAQLKSSLDSAIQDVTEAKQSIRIYKDQIQKLHAQLTKTSQDLTRLQGAYDTLLQLTKDAQRAANSI